MRRGKSSCAVSSRSVYSKDGKLVLHLLWLLARTQLGRLSSAIVVALSIVYTPALMKGRRLQSTQMKSLRYIREISKLQIAFEVDPDPPTSPRGISRWSESPPTWGSMTYTYVKSGWSVWVPLRSTWTSVWGHSYAYLVHFGVIRLLCRAISRKQTVCILGRFSRAQSTGCSFCADNVACSVHNL